MSEYAYGVYGNSRHHTFLHLETRFAPVQQDLDGLVERLLNGRTGIITECLYLRVLNKAFYTPDHRISVLLVVHTIRISFRLVPTETHFVARSHILDFWICRSWLDASQRTLHTLKPKALVAEAAERFPTISYLDLCTCKHTAALESLLAAFDLVTHLTIKDASLLQHASFAKLQLLDIQGCVP